VIENERFEFVITAKLSILIITYDINCYIYIHMRVTLNFPRHHTSGNYVQKFIAELHTVIVIVTVTVIVTAKLLKEP